MEGVHLYCHGRTLCTPAHLITLYILWQRDHHWFTPTNMCHVRQSYLEFLKMYPLVQNLCSESPNKAVTGNSRWELPAGNPRQTHDSERIMVGQPLTLNFRRITGQCPMEMCNWHDTELVSAGREVYNTLLYDLISVKTVSLDYGDSSTAYLLWRLRKPQS